MVKYEKTIDKIKFKDVPTLLTIMRSTDSFYIKSGHYHISTCSLLLFYSLVGLKGGFKIIYIADEIRGKNIMDQLNQLG